MPIAGDIVYDKSGQEWEVYLERVLVPCVRLFRMKPGSGARVYKDVPLSEYNTIPGYTESVTDGH